MQENTHVYKKHLQWYNFYMFETHKLTEQGSDEVWEFRGTLRHAVEKIEKYMPEGREKSLFKTNLETALYWGEKAIAGKEGNYSEIVRQNMYNTITVIHPSN